ncbi:ankyrin repeat-containing protein [Planoprotostelium fungivorum]|uniref:Ankyrin repeat-containing protein n=1 Tax=Planoprotostelium fungivorum TaxID=1890364 RepID=A0A2P6NUL9_9EUKA|nr:ankyrin repeat-containing protein [Planoprotostelium fungivorum]
MEQETPSIGTIDEQSLFALIKERQIEMLSKVLFEQPETQKDKVAPLRLITQSILHTVPILASTFDGLEDTKIAPLVEAFIIDLLQTNTTPAFHHSDTFRLAMAQAFQFLETRHPQKDHRLDIESLIFTSLIFQPKRNLKRAEGLLNVIPSLLSFLVGANRTFGVRALSTYLRYNSNRNLNRSIARHLFHDQVVLTENPHLAHIPSVSTSLYSCLVSASLEWLAPEDPTSKLPFHPRTTDRIYSLVARWVTQVNPFLLPPAQDRLMDRNILKTGVSACVLGAAETWPTNRGYLVEIHSALLGAFFQVLEGELKPSQGDLVALVNKLLGKRGELSGAVDHLLGIVQILYGGQVQGELLDVLKRLPAALLTPVLPLILDVMAAETYTRSRHEDGWVNSLFKKRSDHHARSFSQPAPYIRTSLPEPTHTAEMERPSTAGSSFFSPPSPSSPRFSLRRTSHSTSQSEPGSPAKSSLLKPRLTELHEAVKCMDTRKVKKLLSKKKTRVMLTEVDDKGLTPILWATKRDDLAMLSILLEAATKINLNQKYEEGMSLAHLLVIHSNERTLHVMLQSTLVDWQATTDRLETPLHTFAEKFNGTNPSQTFEFWLKRSTDLEPVDLLGETPLHKSLRNQRHIITNILLVAGVNVNPQNKMGETPLHQAIRLGKVESVKLLVRSGALCSLEDKYGFTPLSLSNTAEPEIQKTISAAVDVCTWLRDVGMSEYQLLFLKEDIRVDMLSTVDEGFLKRLGVEVAGHRLRMLQAVSSRSVPSSPRYSAQSRSSPKNPLSMSSTSVQLNANSNKEASRLSLPPAAFKGIKVGRANSLVNMKLQQAISSFTHLKHHQDWLIDEEDLEVIEKIGMGSQGKVYKGLYRGEVEIAIKTIKGADSSSDALKKEIEIISSIQDPNIVRFYGMTFEPYTAIIMEYCGRGSLYNVMQKPESFGWVKLLRFSKQMAKGMTTLHSFEPPIVHRDVKSLNLLVTEDWDLKVSDFGLSRFKTEDNLETLRQLRGTPQYCAPELVLGMNCTTQSDVYGMGIVLWEMVNTVITRNYQRPFAEYAELVYDFQILMQAANAGKRPTIPPTTPESLVTLMSKCLDSKPENRPTSSELLDCLRLVEEDYATDPDAWEAKREMKLIRGTSGTSLDSDSSLEMLNSEFKEDDVMQQQSFLVILLLFLFSLVTPVYAAKWNAGDTIALLLGLLIGFLALCAGLGWYARRSGAA